MAAGGAIPDGGGTISGSLSGVSLLVQDRLNTTRGTTRKRFIWMVNGCGKNNKLRVSKYFISIYKV